MFRLVKNIISTSFRMYLGDLVIKRVVVILDLVSEKGQLIPKPFFESCEGPELANLTAAQECKTVLLR
jgi:hypothetical protein